MVLRRVKRTHLSANLLVLVNDGVLLSTPLFLIKNKARLWPTLIHNLDVGSLQLGALDRGVKLKVLETQGLMKRSSNCLKDFSRVGGVVELCK